MSCSRCSDIHQAQKEGKTQNKCLCDCHNINSWTSTTSTPFITWTNHSGTNVCTCFSSTTAQCQVHPLTSGNTICSCMTSSEQCDNCRG